MKHKKLTGDTASASVEHISDLPPCQCHCDELAPVIEELTRQIHLLGVIIDELVSEFQWQNNQMAEQMRSASNFASISPHVSTQPPVAADRQHRTTLFE